MSEFKKLGPLIDENGVGWLFPSETAVPAPIQNQVADWFWYRRLSDADENKFLRFFQRKERATEARFLALMSAQAMEIDPLVQELFEATVDATRQGKTVVVGNTKGTSSGNTISNGTTSSTGSSDGTTSGKSSGTSSSTTHAEGTSSNDNTNTQDGTSSDNNTHNSQNSTATSAFPESALQTPGPLPLVEEITLTHLASMTLDRNQTTDGRVGTSKSTTTDKGTGTTSSDGTQSGESSGESSGTSHNEQETSGKSNQVVDSTGETNTDTNTTTDVTGGDKSTHTNKGRHMSAQELLSKYLDFIYRCDALMWFVNELEPCFLSVYDDSGVDCFVYDADSGSAGKDGKDGVTFVPHVQVLSDGARIIWTNDGGLPNPDPVEIKNGADGAMGQIGPVGPVGPVGPAGENGATFTPVITEIEGGHRLSWENDKGFQNPSPIDILNGTGGEGGGVPVGGSGEIFTSNGEANSWGKLGIPNDKNGFILGWSGRFFGKITEVTVSKVFGGNVSVINLGEADAETVTICGEEYYAFHPTKTFSNPYSFIEIDLRYNDDTKVNEMYYVIDPKQPMFDPLYGVFIGNRPGNNLYRDFYIRTNMVVSHVYSRPAKETISYRSSEEVKIVGVPSASPSALYNAQGNVKNQEIEVVYDEDN